MSVYGLHSYSCMGRIDDNLWIIQDLMMNMYWACLASYFIAQSQTISMIMLDMESTILLLKKPVCVTMVIDCLLSPNLATQLFRLLNKYKPETKLQKKERLREEAARKAEKGDSAPTKKPIYVKYGINHVTTLIEQKKAQLVVIAHDVDPIEVCMYTHRLKVSNCIRFIFEHAWFREIEIHVAILLLHRLLSKKQRFTFLVPSFKLLLF